MTAIDYDEGCGVEYDHRLEIIDQSLDGTAYVCLNCGAEIFEPPESPSKK
ncbi:hypothetical protein ACFVUS_12635 [Nocardia sp. NPDC058058]